MLNRFLQSVEAIGLDEEVAKVFGRERGRLRTAGMMLGDFDLLIGTTALQYVLTLLTNNRQGIFRLRPAGLFVRTVVGKHEILGDRLRHANRSLPLGRSPRVCIL